MEQQSSSHLTASAERRLSYLRLSLTDRCNLRCLYCMPQEGLPKLRHEDILRYEEILKALETASALGLEKLRLTGGEPLLRKGLMEFLDELNRRRLFKTLSLTTNATLLAPLADELKSKNLASINISLDALDPKVYAALTGHPGPEGEKLFQAAWEGLMAALALGLNAVKINAVLMTGVNEGQAPLLARLALSYPLEVRFIEYMPIGPIKLLKKAVPSKILKERLEKELGFKLVPQSGPTGGAARSYLLPGAPGAIGFISPVSESFCFACNRLRLTADGKLKPCLLSSKEIDIKGPLRNGAGPEELARLFKEAAALKPEKGPSSAEGRFMWQIGG